MKTVTIKNKEGTMNAKQNIYWIVYIILMTGLIVAMTWLG
jgi:hypothetical protein